MASLTSLDDDLATVEVNQLYSSPFAIAECKRVGIEEGTRKGLQTIEKAKQGAYVARTVSSLQKIRLPNGEVAGVIARTDGKLLCKKYDEFMREIVASTDPALLCNFILTIGVVSNHGNWFTSDNHNKELKVLAQSYDWLLFLTDEGLAEFVSSLILYPKNRFKPIREAFLASYRGKSGSNQFTKVQMAYSADQLLQEYFSTNSNKIESWFNIITPKQRSLTLLQDELHNLASKNWQEIHK